MEKPEKLETRSNSAFCLIFHLVLCSKFRNKSLSLPLLHRLEEITDDVLRKWDCRMIEFGGEADHVHILFRAIPSVELSKLVNNIKSVSSRRCRKEFQEHLSKYYWGKPQFWSGSYSVISVGTGVNLETLIKYVQNQETPES